MSRVDLERRARDARDMAMRARRLAQGLSQAADRERFNRFADEEEERAAGLEAAAAAALGPISPKPPSVAQPAAPATAAGKGVVRRGKPGT